LEGHMHKDRARGSLKHYKLNNSVTAYNTTF
jgi:hypothetical protein